MKKYFLLLLLFGAFRTTSHAQSHKFNIGAGIQQFSAYGTLDIYKYNFLFLPDLRLFLKYNVTRKTQIGIGYSLLGEAIQPGITEGFIHEHDMLDTSAIGKIESRKKYMFFDLFATHAFQFRNHKIAGLAGLSLVTGINRYKTKLDIWYNLPYELIIYDKEYKEERGVYLGAVAGLTYDYSFCSNRLNAGMDFLARYYPGDFPFTTNYGIHIGYSF